MMHPYPSCEKSERKLHAWGNWERSLINARHSFVGSHMNKTMKRLKRNIGENLYGYVINKVPTLIKNPLNYFNFKNLLNWKCFPSKSKYFLLTKEFLNQGKKSIGKEIINPTWNTKQTDASHNCVKRLRNREGPQRKTDWGYELTAHWKENTNAS